MFECQEDEFAAAGYYFSVIPALPGKGEQIGVAISGHGGTNGSREFLIAKKIARPFGRNAYVKWADSRTCPKLTAVVDQMTKVEQPRLVPRDFDFRSAHMVLDGASFELSTPAIYPRERAIGQGIYTETSTVPLGRWSVTH